MTRLEDGALDKSEETFRAVSGLLSLLQCFQGDMHAEFQQDMVSFFCGRFAGLQEIRSVFHHLGNCAQELALRHTAPYTKRSSLLCISETA